MNKLSEMTARVTIVLLLCQFAIPVLAQEPVVEGVDDWRALDEDLRQAMVEEIAASRGLDANDHNPDWLIHSAEDIADALRVSCDLSGACDDASERATLGENLGSFPAYDERQGLLNAAMIRQRKSGHEN